MSEQIGISGNEGKREINKDRKFTHPLDGDAELSPRDEILSWLPQYCAVEDAADAEVLDLNDYLHATLHIELSPAERLRQLAIFLEPKLASPQPRGWFALDRIFQKALRMTKRPVWIHHSRALAAKHAADLLSQEDDQETIDLILNDAWDSANEALGLAPNEEDVLYLAGCLAYFDPRRTQKEALEFFKSALELAPEFQWARLYSAHCYQDMARWSDAYNAYNNVDATLFEGPKSWRYELILEQKAYCRLQTGDRDGATTEFLELLDRWQANPNLAEDLLGIYVTEAAAGPLRKQLWDSLKKLVDEQGWDWLEKSSR